MDIKPFYKTSEWWLSLFATVGSLLISSGLLVSVPVALKMTGIIVGALAAYGYTARRTALKADVAAYELRQMELQQAESK